MISKKNKFIIYLTSINICLSSFAFVAKLYLGKDKDNVIKNNDVTIDDSNVLVIETSEDNNDIIEGINFTCDSDIAVEENEMTIEDDKSNIEIYDDCNGVINCDVDLKCSDSDYSLKICHIKVNNKVIKIASNSNGFSLVKVNNYIGFVSSDCISDADNNYKLDHEYYLYKDVVLTLTDLNFRSEPSIDNDIIKMFRINTELQVLGIVDNDWLLVNYNGILGYVKKEYTYSLLDKLNCEYPEWCLDELNFKSVVYVNCDELNIRCGSSIDYSIIGKLEKLEAVRVIDEVNGFYFVMNNDYSFGYIKKDYTKELNDIFVEVDLSEQRLYMYNNNILNCVASITSGKDSTPSDKGLFAIWYKGMNEEIVPNYLVDYWMPYNLSCEGLHDAQRWRSEFGMHTEEEKKLEKYRYNGSNGCINMKREDAKLVYENVSIGTKVLVHK